MVVIQGEVDRVYENAPDVLHIQMANPLTIQKQNFNDVVVWNPWIEKAQKMNDFDDQEYKEMICVEVGQVIKPVTLTPGQSWRALQTISV